MSTECLFKMWFSKCGLRPAASPGNLLEMQISRLYLKPLCVCVCLVAWSGLTFCDPVDCSLPGSSVHGDSPGKNTHTY